MTNKTKDKEEKTRHSLTLTSTVWEEIGVLRENPYRKGTELANYTKKWPWPSD